MRKEHVCVRVGRENNTYRAVRKDSEQVCRRQDKYQEEGEKSEMEKVKKKVWE